MLYLSIDFSFFSLLSLFLFFPFSVACLKGEKVEVVSFFSSCFSFVLVRAGGWVCVFIHGVTVLRAPGKERERERTNSTIDQMVDPLYYVLFFPSSFDNGKFSILSPMFTRSVRYLRYCVVQRQTAKNWFNSCAYSDTAEVAIQIALHFFFDECYCYA